MRKVRRHELDSSGSGRGAVSDACERGNNRTRRDTSRLSATSFCPETQPVVVVFFWLVTLVTATPNGALTSFLPWSVVADNSYWRGPGLIHSKLGTDHQPWRPSPAVAKHNWASLLSITSYIRNSSLIVFLQISEMPEIHNPYQKTSQLSNPQKEKGVLLIWNVLLCVIYQLLW